MNAKLVVFVTHVLVLQLPCHDLCILCKSRMLSSSKHKYLLVRCKIVEVFVVLCTPVLHSQEQVHVHASKDDCQQFWGGSHVQLKL
jgi:hypothetical protein